MLDSRFNPYQNGYDPKLAEEILNKKHQEFITKCKDFGEENGRLNIPISQNDPFELELRGAYQQLVEEFHRNQGGYLNDIYGKNYKKALDELKERENNPKIEIDEIDEENKSYNEKIANLKKEVEEKKRISLTRDELVEAEKKLDDTQEAMSELSKRIGRNQPFIKLKPYWFYVLLLGLIGFCEVPLNYQVFKSFRETPIFTLIMSGTLVLAIPLLSHFSGMFIKQRKEKSEYKKFALVSSTLIILLSIVTAYLRHYYLIERQSLQMIFNIPIDIIAFFVISLLLFFVGMISSYFAHDESHELTLIYSELQHNRHRKERIERMINAEIEQENKSYYDEIDRMNFDHNKTIKSIQTRPEQLKEEIFKYAADYDSALNFFKAKEEEINQMYYIAVAKYREYNLKFRTKEPPNWDVPITLEFRFKNLSELNEIPRKNN